jgi:hypothetical protein
LQALVAIQLIKDHGVNLVSCHGLVLAGEVFGNVRHEGTPLTGFNRGFHVTNSGDDPLFNGQGLVTGGQ